MNQKVIAKKTRLRLGAASYREMHERVLERDGWRCQFCGRTLQLQVHHLTLRSHSGGDATKKCMGAICQKI
jgi:5-methylcytosine-specific restriction endonuclease McrA